MNTLLIFVQVAETYDALAVCWIRIMHLLHVMSTLAGFGKNVANRKKKILYFFCYQVNFPSTTDISTPPPFPPPFCRLNARIRFSGKKRPTLAQTSVLVMGVLCGRDHRCRRDIKSLTVINCSHCIRCRLQMFTYVPDAKINGRNKVFCSCWSKYGVTRRR